MIAKIEARQIEIKSAESAIIFLFILLVEINFLLMLVNISDKANERPRFSQSP